MSQTGNASLQILKETPYWIAVNKPAGLIVERNPFESITLESLVEAHLQKKEKRPFLGVIHRLDKVTSGVIIFAKKKSALKKLNFQFQERSVQKTYLAIVTGSLPATKGRLDHWLEKDVKEKRARIVSSEQKNAKKASLVYQLLAEKEAFKLLKIELLTGRYHQIRAQLAAISCPILGDAKYIGEKAYTKEIALHAYELTFKNPQNDRLRKIQANLPRKGWWKPFTDQL